MSAGFEVRICPLALSPAGLRRAEALLSAPERARADRFARPGPRTAFIAARGALRAILGERLSRHPAALDIRIGEDGKPALACAQLAFNISHSGGWLAVGVAASGRIGIDIETTPALEPEMAARILHPQDLPASGGALVQVWTAKEALLKAAGCGLRIEPATFPAPPIGQALRHGPALLRGLRWAPLRWAGDEAFGAAAWDADTPAPVVQVTPHPLEGERGA